MQALIAPNQDSPYVSGWTYNEELKYWEPVFEDIPDSWRVAQVQVTSFAVTSPLFWTNCADNVVADEWYYQTSTGNILPIPAPPPMPRHPPSTSTGQQPTVGGAQTL